MTVEWNEKQLPQVQRLALSGIDLDCSLHLVLTIRDARSARDFLDDLLEREALCFGEPLRGDRVRAERADRAVSIGFTYRGLERIGVPERFLRELQDKANAFHEGAPARAAHHLGDTGPGAVECWETMFGFDSAHVLIAVHGKTEAIVESIAKQLASRTGAQKGFEGWQARTLKAKHLTEGRDNRTAHFGFRDGIARPQIPHASSRRNTQPHEAGELVLGYPNDEKFNRWDDERTSDEIAQFFRNASFAVLRKIEQHEDRFNDFLHRQAAALKVTPDYLKAKLCGRWPNGALIRFWHDAEPRAPTDDEIDDFDFSGDPRGFGCPLGAHIRRTNPRDDPITPPRRRPLFRRGMPYGPAYSEATKGEERGLIGLFFCASIEDQFEVLMSEWVEKKPMGPPNFGNAKDPLVGRHDGTTSVFHIPEPGGPGMQLTGFTPFVTTRGTLYALFPSRFALHEIVRFWSHVSQATRPSGARRQAAAPSRSTITAAPHGAANTLKIESAPSDRFCDIVMEGGVTSGIIYASAVAELAKSYRFKSIGGSSIGAFAAALTAAAEYRRRHGSIEGFQLMASLPNVLAEEDDKGRTRLLRMFRPQDATRRLFEIFLAMLGDKWNVSRVLCGLRAAIWQYRGPVLVAVVVTLVLVLAGPLVLPWDSLSSATLSGDRLQLIGLSSLSFALFVVLTFVVAVTLFLAIVRDFRRGLVPNGFGLCRGWSKDEKYDSQDLALFLHGSIQKAAGRDPISDPPLTFKDLWEAPGAPSEVLGFRGNDYSRRSINLEVYATNLAHGRPYRLPLDPADDMGRLFFRVEDLEPYFPQPVLNHLVVSARTYRPQRISDPKATQGTEQFLELPQDQLPIVVAARLAMSFPLLISAIPLWAIDYEPRRANRKLERCWISDGGLCSNFPIHLFDSFVPKWPTFGISLLKRGKYRPEERVWLPDIHSEGRADSWYRFADSKGPLSQLAGFLVSLWLAAWRWNDTTMMRMPGVRDRVVRVLLEDKEGGVNINMSHDDIKNLADNYGKPAAEAFLKKFAIDQSPGWPEHRWVRFNRLLIALREQIEGFTFAADLGRHTQPLRDQVNSSRGKPPLRGPSHGCTSPSEGPLDDDQVRELRVLLASLSRLESMFDQAGDHKPYISVPRPSLRVRHPT
jgi:deferrochelatase/peroxidase EfeB/predicted acylesterase/phospholipase RssA